MTSVNRPTISVVIPVKDRKESLLRAIASVKNQACPVKEIIVVDDGSGEVISDDVLKHFPDVICLRNERSQGAPFSRNRGWRNATADLIAFLDSDDEMTPFNLRDKIDKLVGENLDLVVGSFSIERNGVTKPFYFRVNQRSPLRDQLLMNTPFDARTSTMVVRRAILEKISFDELLKKHQDWDLFINIDAQFKTGFTNQSDVILHISENDRISSSLKHDSTRYFIEKNKDKVSPDALFLFVLKMLYKSVIRTDKEGMVFYRELVIAPRNLSFRYRILAYLIRLNILNVSFLHTLKRLTTSRR